MMSLRHFIAVALTASCLAVAQDSQFPTRLLSNPVQPTAFSDDPALTTHRPLVIVTPSGSVTGTDIPQVSSDVVLSLPETTVTLHAQTTLPTPSSPPPTSSSSSPSGLFPQTTFPNTSTTTTAAETSRAPSGSASLTTLTGTHTTLTSNPASVPTAFANAAAGLVAIVGLAMAL